MTLTLKEAASSLHKHLRSKFNNPMEPWFGVATRTDTILIIFDRYKPCSYTTWEGYEVEYMDSGKPIMGTGDDEWK